jgi:hypothetical protein
MFYTHVNRNTIDSNRKNGTDEPTVRFQKGKYGKPVYAHRVRIDGPCEVISSMHEPLLPCGARLVIASTVKPEVVQ